MAILFTLGLYQKDRPERWKSKHKVYSNLSLSLEKLGFECYFLSNSASFKPKLITNPDRFFIQSNIPLNAIIETYSITHIFVWGGRTEADKIIRYEAPNHVKIIYSESGWFPQSGSCYFSPFGTNASADLSQEGLAQHNLDKHQFNLMRKSIAKKMLGFWRTRKLLDFYSKRQFDTSKPIFIPLQDENDTNIELSSPVKSMGEFIAKISNQYPSTQFIVRPHPRAKYSTLPQRPNLVYQPTLVNPYLDYKHIGGVIGINSTMLLQFSLLGLPVAAIGKGVASNTGAYFDLDYYELPKTLNSISYEGVTSAKSLDFLIRVKQIPVKKLSSSQFIKKCYLYRLLISTGS